MLAILSVLQSRFEEWRGKLFQIRQTCIHPQVTGHSDSAQKSPTGALTWFRPAIQYPIERRYYPYKMKW